MLDPDKAPGLGNYHPCTLKELADEPSVPLSIIFNKSLIENIVLGDWAISNVNAIYKKD